MFHSLSLSRDGTFFYRRIYSEFFSWIFIHCGYLCFMLYEGGFLGDGKKKNINNIKHQKKMMHHKSLTWKWDVRKEKG